MIGDATALRFDPILPWWVVAVLAGLALLVAGFALWRGLRGWAWRGLAGLAAALALAGPALEIGSRAGLSDIVVLVDDRSASQNLPERAGQTDAAIDALSRQIGDLPDTELRRVTVGDDPDGTLLATAIARAVAAEPDARLAGVIAVTDGQIHDPAMLPAALPATTLPATLPPPLGVEPPSPPAASPSCSRRVSLPVSDAVGFVSRVSRGSSQ